MRIRPKAKLFELADWNMKKLATAIGVSLCQVYRVKDGKRWVNGEFIAGALTAFPKYRFDELFYIEGGHRNARSRRN